MKMRFEQSEGRVDVLFVFSNKSTKKERGGAH